MSNRFHSKFHRKNHHTYSNYLNPDSGHDPIASREQPFQGDFILSGSLSCVAPASGFGGFFYTDNTALCAVAGQVGAHILSYGPIGTYIQSNNVAISANAPVFAGQLYSSQVGLNVYGGNNGIISYSPYFGLDVFGGTWGGRFKSTNRALSAFGGQYGLDVISSFYGINSYGNNVAGNFRSPTIALSASGGNIGLFSYSPSTGVKAIGDKFGGHFTSNNVGLSSYGNYCGLNVHSPTSGVVIASPSMTLSTDGGGVNILNSRTGIFRVPQTSYESVTGVVFDVNGNSYFDGDVSITGNLSALGSVTYLDTSVIAYSSFEVVNATAALTPAATFIQYGTTLPTLVCYNGDTTTTPQLYVKRNKIGINISNPSTIGLTVNGNISASDNIDANNGHVFGTSLYTINGINVGYDPRNNTNSNNGYISFYDQFHSSDHSTYVQRTSDVLYFTDAINGNNFITLNSRGNNVGINTTYDNDNNLIYPNEKLTVNGNISSNNISYFSGKVYTPYISNDGNTNTPNIALSSTGVVYIPAGLNVPSIKNNSSSNNNITLATDGKVSTYGDLTVGGSLISTNVISSPSLKNASSSNNNITLATDGKVSTHSDVTVGGSLISTNVISSPSLKNASSSNNNITLATDGTVSTHSDVTVGGSIKTVAPKTVTADYTVSTNDYSIISNKASGSLTLTLPVAASNTGRVLMIKNISTSTVISNTNNVVPLIGGSQATAILSNTAGKWATLHCDGTNWIIMASN